VRHGGRGSGNVHYIPGPTSKTSTAGREKRGAGGVSAPQTGTRSPDPEPSETFSSMVRLIPPGGAKPPGRAAEGKALGKGTPAELNQFTLNPEAQGPESPFSFFFIFSAYTNGPID